MSNSEATLMDEIKEIKSELEEILDFADRRLNIGVFAGSSTPSKDKLMRLIGLVEEEQIKKCIGSICSPLHISDAQAQARLDDKQVRSAPRVSQQLTEKD